MFYALQMVLCHTTLQQDNRWVCLQTQFMSTILSMMELSSTGVCVCARACMCVCFIIPPSFLFHTPLHCFIIALILCQYFSSITLLLPGHHGESKETRGGERGRSGSLLLGNTAWEWLSQPCSRSLKKQNEQIRLLLTVVFGLWHGE